MPGILSCVVETAAVHLPVRSVYSVHISHSLVQPTHPEDHCTWPPDKTGLLTNNATAMTILSLLMTTCGDSGRSTVETGMFVVSWRPDPVQHVCVYILRNNLLNFQLFVDIK